MTTIFFVVSMFGFLLQISYLITEKELKLIFFSITTIYILCFHVLQQAMTMISVFDTADWLSWLTWEGILTVSALNSSFWKDVPPCLSLEE